jgi:Helix-turn-helix domain
VAEEFNPWRMFVGAFVPNWLRPRREISPGAKLCWATLAQHAGQDGLCKPRQSVLAEELGVTDRQVRRYIEELETLGLLRVEQLGLQQANRYHFLWHPWIEADDPDRKHPSGPDRTGHARPVGADADVRSERTPMSGPSKGRESVEETQQKRSRPADTPSLPGRGIGNVRELKAVAVRQSQRREIAERAYLRWLERYKRKPRYGGKLFEDAIFEMLEADHPLTRVDEALDRCDGSPWRFKEETAILKGKAEHPAGTVPERPEYQPMPRREDQDIPDTPEHRARVAANLERVQRTALERARKAQAAGYPLSDADQRALAWGAAQDGDGA